MLRYLTIDPMVAKPAVGGPHLVHLRLLCLFNPVVGTRPSFTVPFQSILPSIEMASRPSVESQPAPLFLTPSRRTEVIGPHVVLVGGPEPDARAITRPESPSLGLSLGHSQAFATPYSLHSLVIHSPALPLQKPRYPSIPIATVARYQLDNPPGQPILIISDLRPPALCTPGLTHYPACPALGDP
jgi:hypothetical protein